MSTPPRSGEPLHHPAKHSSHWTETQHIQMQTDSPVAVDDSRSDESYRTVPIEGENSLPRPPPPPPSGSRAPWLDYDEVYERRRPQHLVYERRRPQHFICGNALMTMNLHRIISDRAATGDSSTRSNTNTTPRAWRENARSSSADDEFETAMRQLKKTAYKPCSSSPQKQTALSRVISGIYRAAGTARTEAATNEEEEKACIICLEAFRPGEQVVVTPCNHMFHQECVAPWVKGHFSCPVCRSALRKSGGNVAVGGEEDAGAGWAGVEAMMMAMGLE